MSNEDIVFHERPIKIGLLGEIVLNRPRALNALTLDMCQRFCEQLLHWKNNDNIKAVIVKGTGDRAFCAGGDIRRLYQHRHENPELLSEFFWHEYRLNAFIHHFPKPYLSILHNITMGGGAGVSIHGTYRIATENLVFAMPETKIGFYPDIGAVYFLNQCPDYTGLYLGLTGNSIGPAAACELGLVTHMIPQAQLTTLETALWNADKVSTTLLNKFSVDPGESELTRHRATINDCFSADSVQDIIDRLEQHGDWATTIAQQLKSRSPTSLKITFEALQRAKTQSFDDIMQSNFDLSQQFLKEDDFFEGIRATIIDKDRSPRWQPGITTQEMEPYFAFKGRYLF